MIAAVARRAVTVIAGVALVSLAVVLVVRFGSKPPEGPVDVAWDRETCAECRMLVGDPRFAAQLQTSDGEVLVFDDPGCLFRYAQREQPTVHAIYFHHLEEDRWIGSGDVAFVPVPDSPMGYGLAAVDRGTPGSLSLDAARAHALAGHAEGGAPGHGTTERPVTAHPEAGHPEAEHGAAEHEGEP